VEQTLLAVSKSAYVTRGSSLLAQSGSGSSRLNRFPLAHVITIAIGVPGFKLLFKKQRLKITIPMPNSRKDGNETKNGRIHGLFRRCLPTLNEEGNK
jgi:hypothetical protein